MLGGNGGLFESSASLLADAWSERTLSSSLQAGGGGGVTAHQQRNRFPEYNGALVARTLMQHSAPQATRQTKKDAATAALVGTGALPAPPPPLASAPSLATQTPAATTTTSPDDDVISYCDAYPNTNTTQVDWALYAAHRVAGVTGVELEKGKANAAAAQERNLWSIFFGKCGGDRRYKNDQRAELLEKLTLQGVLLAMFVPQQVVQYFNSIAAQHTRLHLAARQCVAQVDYNLDTLKNHAAHERDLLIKRILFHADNGQTECRFSIDSQFEFRNQVSWSQYTLDSVKEADLFGRAIGVLVHQVLQSPSLRVKAADCGGGSVGKKIDLVLSWKAALDNLRPKDPEVRLAGAAPTLARDEPEPQPAQPAQKEAESASARQEAPLAKSSSGNGAGVASRTAAPYLPNPLFDNETFIAYGPPSSATILRPTAAATTATRATAATTATRATAVAAAVAAVDDAKSVNSGGETAYF